MTTEFTRVQGEMSGTVVMSGMDRATVEHVVGEARERARQLTGKGPLQVEGDLDDEGRLTVTLTGAVASALRVLEACSTNGDRLFPERAQSSLLVRGEPVSPQRVVAITDHLMGASENHPRDGAPLDFRTEYDECHKRLAVQIKGSLFSTNYLMFLVHLQLTQGRS